MKSARNSTKLLARRAKVSERCGWGPSAQKQSLPFQQGIKLRRPEGACIGVGPQRTKDVD